MSMIKYEESASEVPTHAPAREARRRSRRWWAVGAVVAAVLAAVLVARPGQRQVEPEFLTEPAVVSDLQDVVEGEATIGLPDGDLVSARASTGGVVTTTYLEVGDAVEALVPVVDVNGTTLWAVTGADPVYRDLREGRTGQDVATVEESLSSAGYDPGEVDDTYTEDTRRAVEEWQEDEGLPVTGEIQVGSLVWVQPASTVLEAPPAVGSPVQAGDQLLTAGTDARVAQVTLDQADAARVSVGDPVSIDLDGLDEPVTGAVTAASELPTQDGTYEVTVDIDTREGTKVGMEGAASIVVDVRTDVVTVPTGVLVSSETGTEVDVLVDGEVESRSVTVGLITPTLAEVTSGVAAGEQVILGETSS
jgi:peptidoglycan hydrolase-like protein with peptidoglycan-binding domain